MGHRRFGQHDVHYQANAFAFALTVRRRLASLVTSVVEPIDVQKTSSTRCHTKGYSALKLCRPWPWPVCKVRLLFVHTVFDRLEIVIAALPILLLNIETECNSGAHIVTLRSNDADGEENVKKTIGFISKTTALHVHHTFFVHFFPVFARLRRENA